MKGSKTSKGGGRKRQAERARGEPAEREAPREKPLSREEKARKEQRRERNADFPVVALGASAGGLDALSKFFGAVPEKSGLAYVVIQHLSPKSDSILSELLDRAAHLHVVEAEDGMKVEPDCAYVMPPRYEMAIEHGVLRLSEPAAGHRLPIDFFMRSLASERKGLSIAVILSGTGTDGTLGVEAIKGENGLAVVQTPESAEYPGMPQSVAATGLVDFSLAPERIPGRLMEYLRRMPGREARGELARRAERPEEFKDIFAMLRNRTGHDLSQYKTNTIVRRVRRRMAVHGIEGYSEYLRVLRDQPDELDTLFNELLIRVSGFFRDADAFEVLARDVVPNLFRERSVDNPVRVWVPGCSTGEEAYSIAILLSEHMDKLRQRYRVQIFVTDIDASALDIGRTGRYPINIEQDVSEQRLHRFFTKRDNEYEVNKNLREMLVFAEQSVIKDPPFSRQDLVSCRNLLIYMGAELQKRVLPLFHYALAPKGYLFLGSSETVGDADDLFEPIDNKWKIYQRRDGAMSRLRRHALPMFSTQAPTTYPQAGATAEARDRTTDIGDVAERLLLRDYTPACVIINDSNEILYFHGQTGKYLEPPSGAPTVDVLQMARKNMASPLRTAIHQARTSKRAVRGGMVRIEVGDDTELVRFSAIPIIEPQAPHGAMLVLMEATDAAQADARVPVAEAWDGDNEHVMVLERELESTKEALHATIEELETSNEELQSSNEELQSSNEELQSSNEELETSREELQSVNEELQTVNSELEGKVEELSRAHDDINNLLASTAIGIIFLDSRLRIQRFTPAVTSIVPLLKNDVGRPLSNIVHNLEYQSLPEDLEEVLRTLVQKEREVRSRDGRWYLTRMRPYRTSDDRVRGAVLAFIDVTDKQRLAFLGELMSAMDQCASMVLITGLDGRIDHVNAGFTEATGYDFEELAEEDIDLLKPNYVGTDWKAVQRTLRGGKVWRGEVRYRRKNDGELRVDAVISPIRANDSEVTHAVAYIEERGEEL